MGKDGACASSMKEVYEYWKCDVNTQNFTGHAVALYQNDNYLTDKKQTWKCIERIKLYAHSLSRFEKSPYIYPVWGLGGLPEGFSRLAAVHGGVYMLRREIEEVLYDDKGAVTGVKVKDEGSATCKTLIGDPSYFQGTKQTGHKSDIYISVQSAELQVAPKGRWIAMISSQVYTANPKHELGIAYKLLGKVLKDFFTVNDTFEAANQGVKDNV